MGGQLSYLFEESKVRAYDQLTLEPALEEGLAQKGLTADDVIAVTSGGGIWAICTTGVLRVNIRGFLKKRAEADELIPFSSIEEVRTEPSGPWSAKVVMTGVDGVDLAQMEYRSGGDTTVEMVGAEIDRVMRILETASRRASS